MGYNAYINSILNDVKDYEQENFNVPVENVNLLSFKRLLKEYLEWNGIIGYDKYILALIEYCLPLSEEDLEA